MCYLAGGITVRKWRWWLKLTTRTSSYDFKWVRMLGRPVLLPYNHGASIEEVQSGCSIDTTLETFGHKLLLMVIKRVWFAEIVRGLGHSRPYDSGRRKDADSTKWVIKACFQSCTIFECSTYAEIVDKVPSHLHHHFSCIGFWFYFLVYVFCALACADSRTVMAILGESNIGWDVWTLYDFCFVLLWRVITSHYLFMCCGLWIQ